MAGYSDTKQYKPLDGVLKASTIQQHQGARELDRNALRFKPVRNFPALAARIEYDARGTNQNNVLAHGSQYAWIDVNRNGVDVARN